MSSVARQKSALVTGASSGIGYATAIELAKRGYLVFAGARRLEPMEPLKEHGVITIELDVSSLESVEKAKKFISDKTDGYLDILYNNAGQSCTFAALDVTDEDFKQCYEVNVFGPIRTVRVFGPLIINAKGVIGFTGSVSGVIPFPFSCIYSSTKAAIHQYAATLRIEMKPFGVRVVNVVTGGVKTNIADTRDSPKDSIYRVGNLLDIALKERQEMAVRNKPISAETYAKQVVDDFEGLTVNGYLNTYRGGKAKFLAWLLYWCPRFVVESALIRKFKLVPLYKALSLRYSKEKLE